MKVLIEIDDKDYADIMSDSERNLNHYERLIKKGIPLPKGHGRIGDLDFLAKRIICKPPIGEIGKVTLNECYQEVLSASAIIEADKAESENKV